MSAVHIVVMIVGGLGKTACGRLINLMDHPVHVRVTCKICRRHAQ